MLKANDGGSKAEDGGRGTAWRGMLREGRQRGDYDQRWERGRAWRLWAKGMISVPVRIKKMDDNQPYNG